jgi:cytochrome c551/c552
MRDDTAQRAASAEPASRSMLTDGRTARPVGATPGRGAEGAAGSASTESGAALAKSQGCLGCHAVDQKKVGPSFNDIAAKYKGQKEAAPTVIARLREGKGHPKATASEAELRKILDEYVFK